MKLENKLTSLGKSIPNATWKSIEKAVDLYNRAYEKYPKTTNFLSTAVGTIGGDYIAKKVLEGEDINLRDLAFTSAAAVYQSWLYPKFIDYTNKIAEMESVKKVYNKLGISKEWTKTLIIGGLFFAPNMAYWGLLSVKNQAQITMKAAKEAAKSIAMGSIPYLGVDYIVMNKMKKKYCLPMWSAAELAYNTFLAGVAYLTK